MMDKMGKSTYKRLLERVDLTIKSGVCGVELRNSVLEWTHSRDNLGARRDYFLSPSLCRVPDLVFWCLARDVEDSGADASGEVLCTLTVYITISTVSYSVYICMYL